MGNDDFVKMKDDESYKDLGADQATTKRRGRVRQRPSNSSGINWIWRPRHNFVTATGWEAFSTVLSNPDSELVELDLTHNVMTISFADVKLYRSSLRSNCYSIPFPRCSRSVFPICSNGRSILNHLAGLFLLILSTLRCTLKDVFMAIALKTILRGQMGTFLRGDATSRPSLQLSFMFGEHLPHLSIAIHLPWIIACHGRSNTVIPHP
jgi:hypothetical protein